MLHHVGVRASDFETSKRFYAGALAPLGYVCFYEAEGVAEFGQESRDFPTLSLHSGEPTQRFHAAFVAGDRVTVEAFYAAAIAAGGTDNGPPGARPQYRAYCAFVLDPDGNNIEAVFKEPR